MIQVNQTAKTLDEGIKNLMDGAKDDYIKCSTHNSKKELTGYSKEQADNWDSKTKVSIGKKYIKVVQENGVFAFIVKEDFKHFKKGDILKKNKVYYVLKNDKIKDKFKLNIKNKKKLRFFIKVKDGVQDMGLYHVKRFYKNYVIFEK